VFCESIELQSEKYNRFLFIEFCLRDDLNKAAARVMAVLDP
jgi:hypothetical protein